MENIKFDSKSKLYLIVGILALASIYYRGVYAMGLEQTTLLYVGLPSLITVLLIKYSKQPKTTYGVVFRVITLFLLMVAILFGEGTACIIMAAPLFYGIPALIIFVIKFIKKRDSQLHVIAIIPVLLILSQAVDYTIGKKIEEVSVTINVPKESNLNSFLKKPDFSKNLPNFFKLGFPKPVAISGEGMKIGDQRIIKFESDEKGKGILTLLIVNVNENKVVFKPISDNTHLSKWLTWDLIEVEMQKKKDHQTKVMWTTKYHCDLNPSWYFKPLEGYAVKIMNEHLVKSYFIY